MINEFSSPANRPRRKRPSVARRLDEYSHMPERPPTLLFSSQFHSPLGRYHHRLKHPPPTPDAMSRIRALLATARVANMPSVVTNVLAGVMIGMTLNLQHDHLTKAVLGYGVDLPERLQLLSCVSIPALSGLLLYAGGNFLNDWKDSEWDRSHRPERAIPGGLVPRNVYLFAAIALLCGGLGLLVPSGLPSIVAACLIITCILIYTWLHKTHEGAIIPMALCRCGLVVLGWLAVPGAFVTLYLPARSEERRVGKECRSRWSPYH